MNKIKVLSYTRNVDINVKVDQETIDFANNLLECDLEDKSDENNDYLMSIGASRDDVSSVFIHKENDYEFYCDAVSGSYNYYLEYSLGKDGNIIPDEYYVAFDLYEQAKVYDHDNDILFNINIVKK